MSPDFASPMLLLALAVLLLAAGIEDACHRTIGHGKTIALIALAPLWWWSQGLAPWPDMAVQLGIALTLLALFCVPYARGWMAGGDVKLIAALALWLPFGLTAWMLILMSLVGGAVTLAIMVQRRWAHAEGPAEVPYGVAIAIAGLLTLREPILNQFG